MPEEALLRVFDKALWCLAACGGVHVLTWKIKSHDDDQCCRCSVSPVRQLHSVSCEAASHAVGPSHACPAQLAEALTVLWRLLVVQCIGACVSGFSHEHCF